MWDVRLKTPFNAIISGATQSGKTTFIKNLLTLKSQILTQPPGKVFLFYRQMQPLYELMKNSDLIQEMHDITDTGLWTLDQLRQLVEPYKNVGSLIILDDTMSDINKDLEMAFCNLSHHYNTSIIYVTQNLFFNNPIFRTMSLNSQYMIVMNNPRDNKQISILARQMSNNQQFILQAYSAATKKPYSYLLFDFRPETPASLRVRSNIFVEQFPMSIYLEKK